MRIIQKLVLAGLIMVILHGCDEHTPELPVKREDYCMDDIFRKKVKLEQVVMQPVTEGIHLTGSVEANPDKVIQFVSLVGGVVSKTYFSLGDQVGRGQVLAELRSNELSTLQAELQSLDAKIRVAEKKQESVQSMYDDGISTAKDLMEAQSELSIHESERQKIIAHLDLFSASEDKGVFQIKAPASGIVTAKSISTGTQISAEGESLFTISNLKEVWVMVDIYATNVQHIESGMAVNINTLSYPDTIFNGKVGPISQVLDSEAKVLKARVVLKNGDLRLKPGMLVDVIALKDRNAEAIAIPTHSMVFDDNKNFVVVHKSDCDMEIREVEILSSNNGITFISEGLTEDENIISKNQLLIYEQINN